MAVLVDRIVNLSDRQQKRELLIGLGAMDGFYKVQIKDAKPLRSLKANARYWAAVVPAFQTFMQSHGQFFNKDEVHEFFLSRFAGKEVVDPATGEVLHVVGKRSSKMDSDEFSAFTHHIEAWMLDRFNVVIPDPEVIGV